MREAGGRLRRRDKFSLLFSRGWGTLADGRVGPRVLVKARESWGPSVPAGRGVVRWTNSASDESAAVGGPHPAAAWQGEKIRSLLLCGVPEKRAAEISEGGFL